MSQSQQVVNFSSSLVLADQRQQSAMALFETYLSEAQTIKDAPRMLCPRSAVEISDLPASKQNTFDSTKTQWDPQPGAVLSHHGKQTRQLGSARTHNPRRHADADDPIPTPTPQAIRMPASSVSESLETISRPHSHRPVSSDRSHHHCSEADAYAVTQVKSRPRRNDSREIDVGSMVAGRYEILSEISRGGYGIVYRARQIGVDRIVALKRLRSNHDIAIQQRFLLESNIIKNLIHPNTIQLIDAGMDDSHLFIVMEYIEGKSLRAILNDHQPMPPDRAIHIASQILKSLNEAHQRGIIHRDLKPSNILLRNIIGESDFVKVLDFGIAKAKNMQAQKLTEQGKIMGTPRYLAPELLFGEEAGPEADIFAIGLILAEMLTGQPVMPNDLNAIIKLAASKSPIPLPSHLLKTEIGQIIARALEKDPHQRYSSAEEMLYDLSLLASRQPVPLPAVAKPSRCCSLPVKARYSSFRYSKLIIAATLLILTNVYLLYRFIL